MVGATALNKFDAAASRAQLERFAGVAGENLCAISLMQVFPCAYGR
jgi:hypothetical protein